MNERYALDIIKELNELHIKLKFVSDYDSDILSTVTEIPVPDMIKLTQLRINMWIEYTRLLLENLEKLKNKLLWYFFDCKEISNKFRIFKNEYNEANTKFEKSKNYLNDLNDILDKIKKLFNESWNFYIGIDEEVLIRMGKIEFFKIFGIIATIITAVYWPLYFNKQFFELAQQAVLAWIGILAMMYLIIQWYFRREIEYKEDE
jgi:hypothetical protein